MAFNDSPEKITNFTLYFCPVIHDLVMGEVKDAEKSTYHSIQERMQSFCQTYNAYKFNATTFLVTGVKEDIKIKFDLIAKHPLELSPEELDDLYGRIYIDCYFKQDRLIMVIDSLTPYTQDILLSRIPLVTVLPDKILITH